ncbi:MAG: ABC transporter permease [Myxococcota bacterium]
MSLADGALTQLRVVHALALRETRTRFGQNRLGYFWALVEPTLWILMFYGMYELVDRQVPDGMEVVPFLATGILTYQMFAKTTDQAAAAVSGNKALLYYPHVQTIDLIAARAVLEAVTYVLVLALIVGAHALFSGTGGLHDLLTLLSGLGLASLLGATFGLLLCSLGVLSDTVHRIRGPLMRPLFWTSGLFFTANELPTHVRELLLYNPVLHCVEIARGGWFAGYHAHHADPAYVLVWIVAFAFAGLTLERTVRRRVQVT